MSKTGIIATAIVAVALFAGVAIGQHTTCLKFPGTTYCFFSNPLK